MHHWHPQDKLLVAAALAQFAGPDVDTPMQERAWQLAAEIAMNHSLRVEEIPLQLREPDSPLWLE